MKRLGLSVTILLICSFFMNGQIVINSRFKPFSYDEMMAPVQAYKEFVNQCLSSILDLMENAEQIEDYIDEKKDVEAWRRYANFQNACIDEYNRIVEHGTNSHTRNHINDLKRQFSDVINGIGRAYNRRIDLSNDQYNRLRSTNQRCDRFYIDMSLDEFLDGKTPSVHYY